MKRITVSVTTAADGSATVYSARLSGEIHQIEYVKDGSNGFSNGVGFAVSGEATGVNIWTESAVNASAVRAPRQPTHSQAGAASLYASGGTPVQARIAVAADRLKFVVTGGGNAKTGKFHILLA